MHQNSGPKTIFLEAIEQHDVDQWPAFLDTACGGDDDLRQHIESLLSAHLQTESQHNPFDNNSSNLRADAIESAESESSEKAPLTSVAHFHIIRQIGRGGMGNVYLAIDEHLDRSVAIKLPRINVLGNPRLRTRFLDEAKVAASLRHPSLVEIYEYGSSGPFCYLASRYCPHGDLATWMQRHGAPVKERVVARVIRDVCIAVEQCHRNRILHLDIKPANILLHKESAEAENHETDPGTPLLTDFGLARIVESTPTDNHLSSLIGTPLYMAPEQVECHINQIGPSTDVFAVGVVMFEMLYGRSPFEAETPMLVFDKIRAGRVDFGSQMRPVSIDLQHICEACLHIRPQDRYESAQALADDLNRFMSGQPIRIKKSSLTKRIQYWLLDPQRIRHAGITLLIFQVPGMFSLFALGGLRLMGLTGGLEFDVGQFAKDCAPIVLGINVPSIIIGVKALSQRAWAVPIGCLMSLGYFATAILITMGLMEPFQLYAGFPAAKFLAHFTHAVFAAVQLTVFVLAVPAAIHHWQSSRDQASADI